METTKVNALHCLKCNDVIYSRAIHDMRWCMCENCAIDGGFDYCKLSFHDKDAVEMINDYPVNATKPELYRDWNYREEKFGHEEYDESIHGQYKNT